MNEPKKICNSWAAAIRSGIRLDLTKNPDGRLTAEQVQHYRGEVQKDMEFHQEIEREVEELGLWKATGLERRG